MEKGEQKSNKIPTSTAVGADYIKDSVKKLCLFHTRTFKPILTHDELESILSTYGFLGVPPITDAVCAWREYVWPGTGLAEAGQPRPRLPFPRVDGLHMLTYTPFLEAVNHYLRMPNVADLFHVRGMPLHRVYDRNERWRRMEDDEYSILLYRDGTLDQTVHSFSLKNYQDEIVEDADRKSSNSMVIRKNNTSSSSSKFVPLKDIIV